MPAPRPIARLALPLLAAALGGGCLGDYATSDGSDRGGPDGAVRAEGDGAPTLRDRFNHDIRPVLLGSCGACHAQSGGSGPSFLAGDPYDTVKAWPGMIVRDATQSRLVAKGVHEGPALGPGQLALVLPWLGAEAALLPKDTLESAPATPPHRPLPGANIIPLAPLGADFVGASITFDATPVGASLVMANLQLHAAPDAGLHFVHPLFIVWSDGKKAPDPVDSFAGLDQTVARGDVATLGPGILILDHVGGLDELSVAFAKLERSGASVDGGGGNLDGGIIAGGCKAVVSFTLNVQPTLSQRCVMCHGGANPQATAAVDMTRVNDLGQTAQASACGQVRLRVDLAKPAASILFTDVDPAAGANHPFKFPDGKSFQTYMQMATTWIAAEK